MISKDNMKLSENIVKYFIKSIGFLKIVYKKWAPFLKYSLHRPAYLL